MHEYNITVSTPMKSGQYIRKIKASHSAEAYRAMLVSIRNGEWPENCLVDIKVSGNNVELNSRLSIKPYRFGSGVVIERVYSK
jgi:hypothetical protein